MALYMKLIISIDTEEDDWGQYSQEKPALQNIERVGVLQSLFDKYGVTPTYLVTYPVATNARSISLLRRIMEDGRCEIGTHCHPWNTPPFREVRNEWNSMLCNLPADLQFKKIETLHSVITQNFGVIPTSFRAGRWGLGEEIPRILANLNYKVDSSILAFQCWKSYGGPDFSDIFPSPFMWAQLNGVHEGKNSALLEVPATAGYTQNNFKVSNRIWRALGGKLMQMVRAKGILSHTKLLDKIWLSPEPANSSQMIKLTTRMLHNGYSFLNMFFHSNALKAGNGPYVKSSVEEELFIRKIEEFLVFTSENGIESIKLSDAPLYLNNDKCIQN